MNEQELINELNSFCKYNHETGELIATRTRQGSHIKINEKLGNLDPDGYLILWVNNRNYFIHRLIWLLTYSKFPKYEIGHRDQNSLNNRLDNLEDITHSVNMKNLTKRYDNTSGVTGVRWDKRKIKWQAQIMFNNKQIHLGYFHNKELAIQARKEAEVKYKFSKIHGV